MAVAVANGDVLFAFGGYDGTPTGSFNTVEALTTPPVGDLFISQSNNVQGALVWASSRSLDCDDQFEWERGRHLARPGDDHGFGGIDFMRDDQHVRNPDGDQRSA